MMQTQAPGKTKLKVTGILYIVFAAIAIVVGLIALLGGGLAIGSGISDGAVLVGAIAGVAGILSILGSLLGLITGILGVKNCDKPEKCGVNFVLGIILIVLNVLDMAGDMMKQHGSIGPTLFAALIGLIVPVIYTIGAKQNKDAAAN